jgi:hypothetical protein
MTTISVPEYGTDEQQTKLQTLYLGTKWQIINHNISAPDDGLDQLKTLANQNAMNTRTLRQ